MSNRVPEGFKQKHSCQRCGKFAALWDMDWAKWCVDCVDSNGGLMAAGRIARDEWKRAAEERQAEAKSAKSDSDMSRLQDNDAHIRVGGHIILPDRRSQAAGQMPSDQSE